MKEKFSLQDSLSIRNESPTHYSRFSFGGRKTPLIEANSSQVEFQSQWTAFRASEFSLGNKKNASYLEVREAMLRYLEKLVKRFDYSDSVFFAAAGLLDKVLTNSKFFQFDIALLACFMLALKFRQDDAAIPVFSDFVSSRNQENSIISVSSYEIAILKRIDYNLSFTTAFDFLSFFQDSELLPSKDVMPFAVTMLYSFQRSRKCLDFEPHLVACGVLFICRELFGLVPWSDDCEKQLHVRLIEFANVIILIKEVLKGEHSQEEEEAYSSFESDVSTEDNFQVLNPISDNSLLQERLRHEFDCDEFFEGFYQLPLK